MAEAMDLYINARSGYDTIYIVQNEEELEGMLYHIIQKSKLRVLVVDGLDDSKLRKVSHVRPVPSHFSLIASTKNLINWFEMVCQLKSRALTQTFAISDQRRTNAQSTE